MDLIHYLCSVKFKIINIMTTSYKVKDYENALRLCPDVERNFFIRVRSGKSNKLFSPVSFVKAFDPSMACKYFQKVLRSPLQTITFKSKVGSVTFISH